MGLTAKKAFGASKKYTDDQIAQIAPGGTVVDVVEDGNMSAVTSNAVYDEAQEIKLSISNLSASVLHTSGNETATGVKTFSSGVNSSKGIIGPKASGESDPHVPLELRGSDTEAWVLFSNRLGVGLGYFGTTNDNKPYFYNTEPHELAFKSQIPNKSWTLLNNGSYHNVGANANFDIDSPEATVYRTNPNNYSELRFDIFITDGQDPTTAKTLSHYSFTIPFEIIHNCAISFDELDSIEIWRQIYFDSSDPNVDKSLDHCILTLKFYMDADSYFVWLMRGEPYCPNGYYNMKVYAR